MPDPAMLWVIPRHEPLPDLRRSPIPFASLTPLDTALMPHRTGRVVDKVELCLRVAVVGSAASRTSER
jgi:hypothetical protein